MMDANSACSTSSTNLPTHSFPPGHRIRVAISTAYSPLVWPAPEPVTLGVYASVSVLELPVRPPRPADAELRSFAAPEEGSREAVKVRRPSTLRRTIERDLSRGMFSIASSMMVANSRLLLRFTSRTSTSRPGFQ